jgi:hypothetical protein
MSFFFIKSGIPRVLLLVLLPAFFSACAGYQLAGEYNHLPQEIKSVSIPFFKNETFEANIEAYFTNALINEFIKNQQIVVQKEGADATLLITVKDFRTDTIAYSREDRALEYRAYVTVEATLERSGTGEIIWRNPRLVHDEEYKVSGDIAFTEANKKLTIQKIAQETAERIYEELVLGF